MVFSLVLLGGSLAVFGSVTGVVPDEPHELDIEDGAIVATTDGGQQHVLVNDIRTVNRIEIAHEDSYHVVRTVDRAPTAVDIRTRRRAQRVATSAETVGSNIPATDSAVYAVRRIPARLSSDRAAAIGATPNTSLRQTVAPNASAFTVRQNEDTIVFERRESGWSDDRVLVIVTPNESGVQYSAVVNLRTETVESLVRLNRGGL
ncbi:hypothetical protein C443_00202 [Haloarcula argentinensis DSM 12282]|nr:hypothetical protein C443_00202 [Haloarcula argentinensis DSM 12282]